MPFIYGIVPALGQRLPGRLTLKLTLDTREVSKICSGVLVKAPYSAAPLLTKQLESGILEEEMGHKLLLMHTWKT